MLLKANSNELDDVGMLELAHYQSLHQEVHLSCDVFIIFHVDSFDYHCELLMMIEMRRVHDDISRVPQSPTDMYLDVTSRSKWVGEAD